MKTFIPIWYDNSKTFEDKPIKAKDINEARDLAYRKYNGNPPCQLLYLKEEK